MILLDLVAPLALSALFQSASPRVLTIFNGIVHERIDIRIFRSFLRTSNKTKEIELFKV